MDDPWLTAAQQQVWRDWLQVSGLLPLALHAQLRDDSDLSFPDFEVLSELSETDGHRLRMTDLARAIRWERTRLSHHLRRMERRGLVRREDCTQDARASYVVLTEAGSAAVQRAAPGHARTVRELLFEPMEPGDLETVAAVLDRLARRLERDVRGAPADQRSADEGSRGAEVPGSP